MKQSAFENAVRRCDTNSLGLAIKGWRRLRWEAIDSMPHLVDALQYFEDVATHELFSRTGDEQ